MLEIASLLDELDRAAQSIADDHRHLLELSAIARERLNEYSDKYQHLVDKDSLARNNLGGDWRGGAVPINEPINLAYDIPADIAPVQHVIATDGSQIYPDRHGIAYYALINIGLFHLQPGSHNAPQQTTFPELYYGERMRDDDTDELLRSGEVNRLRDFAELARLIEHGVQQRGTIMALLDSNLLLFVLGPDPDREYFEWYITQLKQSYDSGICLAGYVDRPGSRLVGNVLALASIPDSEINKDNKALNIFRDLPDRLIFSHILQPGQRSAIFTSTSPFNSKLKTRASYLEIAFFYINVGKPGNPIISRVETPIWVAASPKLLGQLHATLWEQCQVPGNYPYALARAHEIALVTNDEQQSLEQFLIGALLKSGLTPRISAKADLKRMTGGR